MLRISVRKAQEKDAQNILDVNHRAIFGINDFLYPQDDKQAWAIQNTESVKELITSDKYNTYVATIAGKVVGYGASKANQVRMLYVIPEYQHKGVASQILKQLEKNLTNPIFKISKNCVAFYQRHGYTIQGKTKAVLNNKSMDAFIVHKD